MSGRRVLMPVDGELVHRQEVVLLRVLEVGVVDVLEVLLALAVFPADGVALT